MIGIGGKRHARRLVRTCRSSGPASPHPAKHLRQADLQNVRDLPGGVHGDVCSAAFEQAHVRAVQVAGPPLPAPLFQPLLHSANQLPRRNSEGFRQIQNSRERGVLLSALQKADVCAVVPALEPKLFLRKTTLFPGHL